MSAAYLLGVQWLLSSAGCVAVGLLAWLLLNGAAQVWPALRTRRIVWLAAQCVVAAAALLPFLPRSAHVTPPVALASAPVVLAAAGLSDDENGAHTDANTHADAEHTPGVAPSAGTVVPSTAVSRPATLSLSITERVLPLLAAGWLLIYLAGLTWATVKLLRARRLWRGLLAAALPCEAPFIAKQPGLDVKRIDAPVSPMLIGVLRPVLLLPAHLDALSTEQQQMIIAHELHHWRVRDPLCLAIAATLQTVFWFNPSLRWMARQMEWALELQCDQQVLAGRPQHQRKQYATALLQQWSAPMGVAAFNGATITARIRHMQKGSLPILSAAAGWTACAALAAVLATGVILQPALAISIPGLPATASVVAPPATLPEAWRAPLDKVRVTSFYGVKRSLPRTPHRGIDFGAANGTPVHATASGTVIAAGAIAENDGKYGNTVIIDHGAQRSFYAHLNSVSVKPGQRVQAGELIGAVGATGLTTGPHLHLEVRQNGKNIDPATMLANLDAYATPRALKVRHQQLPSKG
ncbi:peptidoglycan DD-metalloendopeptidase family protein [Duganella sp. sic0402]|uniref:M23/M56 family metallopeptidase n=1 Tax=Duganella sp. sic0402 TaxID=2854786 RepID=UPI001C46686B|nr:M23/M56 family metallopeptidase [Duganella sp. sic0402]MBV7536747.1 peptidoglycan DD-metalloendopeptidase family protein [Duganella sp. sic0402]